MVPVLAEISDKMGTIPEMWLWCIVLSIPVLIGLVGKRSSWVALAMGVAISAFYGHGAIHQAFREGEFSFSVQHEMGWWWIVNSIGSACLPAVVALLIFIWQRVRGMKGYPSTANFNGIRSTMNVEQAAPGPVR